MNINKNARRGFLYIKRAYFLSSNSAFTFQCKEFHIEYGQTAKTMGRERGDGSRVERKPMQYVPQYSQRLILVDYVKSSSFFGSVYVWLQNESKYKQNRMSTTDRIRILARSLNQSYCLLIHIVNAPRVGLQISLCKHD